MANRWIIRSADPVVVQSLTTALGLPSPIAQILAARGIHTPQAAHAFLRPGSGQLHDPFLFRDMGAAVERLAVALKTDEKVLLYGDYDVDGLTATALLCQVLRQRGLQVEYFVPNRFQDGYGLNPASLRKAREAGFSLVVTVDCGTREIEAAETARELGLDLIVTDHHLPGSRLPSVLALLNPLREDGTYPDPHLCGAGVAYKLAQAFILHQGGDAAEAERQLDLVAIGTVADIVPLLGENRILVRLGMRGLHQSGRPGIQALIEASQIVQEQIGVRQIGFQLAPRINALGRLGNASGAVRLLLTDDLSEAAEIATIMNEANSERQRLQEKVIEDIRRIANAEPDRFSAPVICLGRPGWHRGVIGIAASKVLDWHHRPVVLFSIEDGWAHGSARSIPGVDITHALGQCGDLLERFGGHDQAAGLTLRENNLPVLRNRLERIVEGMLPEGALEPVLEIDAEVRLEQLTEPLVEQLAELGPFGAANPRPVLAALDVCAGDTARIVGNGSLKLMLAQGNSMLDAIAFGQGHRLGGLDLNRLDAAFYPEVNEWRGRRSLQLNVIELRTHESPAPVAAPPVRCGDAPADFRGLRRCVPETLDRWFKELESVAPANDLAVVLDSNAAAERTVRKIESLGIRTAIGETLPEDLLSRPPETVWVLPGCCNPGRVLQGVADLRQVYSEAGIVVVFPREEMDRVAGLLHELYPDRERLLEVYRRLKIEFGREEFELEDAMLVLKAYSRNLLSACRKIFEELDLVTLHADRARMSLKPVRVRRDILMSPTFRQGQALREQWNAWIAALQGPEDAWIRYLNSNGQGS